MKNTTNLFWSFLLIGFTSFSVNAQNKTQVNPVQFGKKSGSSEINLNTNVHRCLTEINELELQKKYPTRLNTQQFEAWLANEIESQKTERIKNNRSINAVYNIPVVIHIIHNGDCVGTGENITDSQAISQLTVMNNDFRRLASTPGGTNSTGLAVDTEINFILAKRDANGQPTTGIIRHEITPYSNSVADGSSGADWETRTDVETMKANTQWDPTKYLNMWIIRPGGLSLNNGGLSGLLGYAQFPDATGLGGLNASGGAANTDGVVCAFDSMGTKNLNDGTFLLNPGYDEGRTMTHEVGHWLGLRHIWGDDGCPSAATNVATNEDYVADTPAAANPNYTCGVVNSCPAPGNDQVQNYMDYTPDACMDTFTAGQKSRMQTIMAGAARRSTLNASQGGTAPALSGVYFKPSTTNCSITEATNCSFTDYNFPIGITKAPTASTVLTFTVNAASTASNNTDFQIITPSVTFAPGDATDKTLTVRIFNDGFVESTETIVIGGTLNANGGDGVLIADYNLTKIKVIDTDVVPSTNTNSIVFSENFDPSVNPRTISDLDGDTRNWILAGGNATFASYGINGNFMASQSWTNATGPLNPDNLLTFTNPIAIPASGTNTLSFRIGANDAGFPAENYAVYVTTSNVNNTIIASTPVIQETLAVGATSEIRTINLNPALAGQNVYLSFRHFNCTDQNVLMLDDITISNSSTAGASAIQTSVNTATAYQTSIKGSGTIYAKDTATAKLMADVTNSTTFDYGCVNTSVSRDQATAGAAAVNYGSGTANNLKVLAKTFTITTANNSPTSAGTIKFYFTDAEIAAWEAATSNNRTALKVIKDGVASTLATTASTFGTNITLSANVTNGLNGTYYFGTDATLSNSSVEFDNSIAIYPNPNKGSFNIQFTSQSNNDIKINIHDIRGREVYSKEYNNNGFFNEAIQLNQTQAGIYIVTIQDGDNKVLRKIIKE